jgi:hypothetical protein
MKPPVRFPWLMLGMLVLAGVIAWLLIPRNEETAAPGKPVPEPAEASPPKIQMETPSGETAPSAASATPQVSPTLTAEDRQRVLDAIDNLEFTFRDYANALGGNPVGTNAEITAALQGDNENQLKLDLPGGSSINKNGELCDPWGTPWFFHQLSAKKMEVRSAGADRILYTEDDLAR